jgi:surface polysaccharide O-acyltransferase-like enzyme
MDKFVSVKLRVLSFLAMIMIIFLHSYNLVVNLGGGSAEIKNNWNSFTQIFISDGITRIAVPLFASISGFLLFLQIDETISYFLTKYRKRFNTLFIPYVLWSAWGLLFFFILQVIPQGRKFFNSTLIKDYSLHQFLDTLFLNPLPYQLWFLRDLIVLVLLSPLIYFFIKHLKIVAVSILFVLWYLDLNFIIFKPDTLFFFAVGIYLSLNKQMFLSSSFPKLSIYTTICWIICLVLKTANINFGVYFGSLFFMKAGILLGLFSSWYLYNRIVDGRDMEKTTFFKFSTFSFFLYAFHEPVLTLLKKASLAFLGKTPIVLFITYLTLPLIVIILALSIAHLLKKYLNSFYNLITGGR